MPDLLINPAAASAGTSLAPSSSLSRVFGSASSLGSMAAGAVNPFYSLITSVLGSVVSNIGNAINSRRAVNQSKELYDYQTDYGKLMGKMIDAGISPAAAAQGLSGATPTMSAVSSAPFSDLSGLGDTFLRSGSLGLEQERNPSVIAKNEAEAAKFYSDEALNRLNLLWSPRRWQQDIDESLSRIAKNRADSFYYNEMARTVRDKRPWEIQGLIQGLENARAECSFLLASRDNQSAQSKFWKHRTTTEFLSHGKLRFQNALLKSGWDPSSPAFQNLTRLAVTRPSKAVQVLDNGVKFLKGADDLFKNRVGKRYKEVVGAALLYNYHSRSKDRRARRRSDDVRSLVGLAGLAGSIGSGSPVPSSFAGTAMDNEDWFDWFSR